MAFLTPTGLNSLLAPLMVAIHRAALVANTTQTDGGRGFWGGLWHSDLARYLAATLFGFAGAYVVEWFGDRRRNNRLGRAARESLIAELTDNFFLLDDWERSLKRILARPLDVSHVPSIELRSAVLDRCLDRATSAVLTEIEQVQSSMLFYLVREFEEEVRLLKESGAQIGRAENMLNIDLPYIGQTMMDLLVEGLIHQGRFSSSRSAAMASALLPVLEQTSGPTRAWRTSDVESGQTAPTPFLVVWRNDMEAAPAGFKVFELRPPGDRSYRTINQTDTSWSAKLVNPIWRWWQRRTIERTAKLADVVGAARQPSGSTTEAEPANPRRRPQSR